MKEHKLFDLANKVNVIVNGNNDKIKQFRPVRSYGDIINLGDVVELSIRDKNQVVFETPKYIGSVSAISKLSGGFRIARTGYPNIYANGVVAFKEKEHVEQAIKMLGDELKYLFEPW